MRMDGDKRYQIYHTVLSMALTWAFVLVINQYFSLKVNIFLTAVLSLLPAILVYLFDLNKKNIISYIIMVSILPLLALIFWIKRSNPVHWLNRFLKWCREYNGIGVAYNLAYALTVIFGLAVLGAILFYLITKKQLLKEILAVVILVVMVILCIRKININKAVVGICVFYFLTIVVEVCGVIYNKKAGRPDKKDGILYLAPICLLLTVISISMPSRPEPIQWTVVKNTYKSIKEQIQDWQMDLAFYFSHTDGVFSLNFSGYSEESGQLNIGSIKQDNRVAMKISGIEQGDSVYLIGSVSDKYTGSSWEKSGKDYLPDEKEYSLDYLEMFLALSRQDMNVLKNNRFVRRDDLEIDYDTIRTKTFFYPLLTNDYKIESRYKELNEEEAQITFNHVQGRNTSYKGTYYEMNLEGAAFQDMLRRADSFSYDSKVDLNHETADYVRQNILYDMNALSRVSDRNIYKQLGERAKLIKSEDTQLPEGFPDRVRKLAADITKNCDTDYDKLKAIEAYLREYKYSLQVDKVPKGEDFTDYFLFESKKGFCTSFATSMAVLGRCVGIPTRYVEGYVARGNVGDANGMYSVKNSQAHAWAEAYIEGVGWIPFEATAPFYHSRYTKWPEFNKDSDSQNSPGVVDYTQFIPKTQQNNLYSRNLGENNHKASGEALSMIIIIVAVLMSLLCIVIIHYFVLRIRYRNAFKKADYSRKMYFEFLLILNLLKREGITLGPQETILMLSKRVMDYLQFNHITFKVVADIYMQYRYAEIPVTSEEFGRVNEYCKGLSSKRKTEENRWKVWLSDYIYLIQTDRQLKRRYNNE